LSARRKAALVGIFICSIALTVILIVAFTGARSNGTISEQVVIAEVTKKTMRIDNETGETNYSFGVRARIWPLPQEEAAWYATASGRDATEAVTASMFIRVPKADWERFQVGAFVRACYVVERMSDPHVYAHGKIVWECNALLK